MKRLAVFLSVIAVLALIVATGNYEINTYRRVGPSLSDGNWPPPPWHAAPAPLLSADGNFPPPPWHAAPAPPLSADGNFPPPPWHTVLNHLSA